MNEERVNDPAEIDDGRELEPIEVEEKPDPLGGQHLIGAVQRVVAWPSPLVTKHKIDCTWEEMT